MDYEKKEVLETLKRLVDKSKKQGHIIIRIEDIEAAFPELEESEDEKIRKNLIGYIKGISKYEVCEETKDSWIAWLEKQGKDGQNPKHFELKAGHWYICHRAFCCRADHLTVKEGERFMCEKDGVVKGFVVKEPEKYFKEVCAPAPMEDEQKPAWSEEDEERIKNILSVLDVQVCWNGATGKKENPYQKEIDWLKSLKATYSRSMVKF